MLRTKLVFTLGPATDQPGVLRALLHAGMDCARFNFSHGTQAEHARRFKQLMQEARRLGKPIATLMDLAGPKLRVGCFPKGQIQLRPKALIRITTRPMAGREDLIPVACPGLIAAVHAGDRILLNDGLLRLQVVDVKPNEVCCRVVTGGILKDHQGMNLPGVPLAISALTSKDRQDLAFGLKLGMDMAALSFVRHPRELHTLRSLIRSANSQAQIVAKIEKPEAIPHLEAIIQAADGVMVARGDLGVEMGVEEVPTLQKRIIALANCHGRFVITATQMLQSMMESPTPTRAEASDIANAIFDGTDAIMLSGESASGAYPRAAAAMMRKIAEQAEGYPEYQRPLAALPSLGPDDELVKAGVHLAEQLGAQALVVLTRSGNTARLVSRQRPCMPIYALAHDHTVQRQLRLWCGTESRLIRSFPPLKQIDQAVEHFLISQTPLRSGQRVVILASSPPDIRPIF